MLATVRKSYNLTKGYNANKIIGTVNNSKSINRDTNIELLRIVAMLMVIAQHAISHGLLLQMENINAYNILLLKFINTFSLTANSIFFVISGYYSINKKTLNIKKILSLWGKVLFYSIVIYVICKGLGRETIAYDSFLPILSGQYWFVSTYIALSFLSPIFNILADKLTRNQYKYLLLSLIIMYGLIKVMFNPSGIFNGTILAAIAMYLLGGYVRKYISIKSKQNYFTKYILLTILFVFISIILQILLSIANNTQFYYILRNSYSYMGNFASIIIVAMTLLIIFKFKEINIKNEILNKMIISISPSVFSVYIIHENVNIRDNLWQVIGSQNYADKWFFIPHLLLLIVAVFIICLVIDLLRKGIYLLLKKIPVIERGILNLSKKIDKVNIKINYTFDLK